jgi:UDP-N-acetylglucosamine 2-epimerase
VVRAIARLARAFPRTRFVHVVHPNPNVLDVVRRNEGLPNVELKEPLDYRELVRYLRRCRFALTDSGGIQEEAPTFGKPALVLRDKTERPEGVEAGMAILVGTDEERIVAEASRLLTDESLRRRLAEGGNPYGDGHASDRIADALAGRPYSPFEAKVALGASV